MSESVSSAIPRLISELRKEMVRIQGMPCPLLTFRKAAYAAYKLAKLEEDIYAINCNELREDNE